MAGKSEEEALQEMEKYLPFIRAWASKYLTPKPTEKVCCFFLTPDVFLRWLLLADRFSRASCSTRPGRAGSL